ncbi:helix-turn-helix transcriptional regulator [Nocardioides sp. BP30]|uniref:helix-turn-helix domain-containing protein n=1 Tax=Nocardioides sp. BP30 TaxID=3036374 RepID=UPI0024685507|nr:helix-turn-helix transcriptional regulator [Nocardioides sp. BP30]WGL53034.1 helix-turn-helix transcriptional regulator [Nocardioides sp. BP30]
MTGERAATWEEFARVLGGKMFRARTAKGISQERVAHLAGVSTYTYQKYEKGESRPGTPMNPQLKSLVAICQVLDLSAAELLADPLPLIPED